MGEISGSWYGSALQRLGALWISLVFSLVAFTPPEEHFKMEQQKILKAFIVFAVVLSFLFPAMAAAPVGASGKWSGAISVTDQAGQTQSQPVFLILTQDGKKLTGSGGPSEDEQGFNIENGTVDGNKLSFDVNIEDTSYHSTAQFTESEMTGETVRQQTNGVKITFKLALQRVVAK
jgi:hypothetical protein